MHPILRRGYLVLAVAGCLTYALLDRHAPAQVAFAASVAQTLYAALLPWAPSEALPVKAVLPLALCLPLAAVAGMAVASTAEAALVSEWTSHHVLYLVLLLVMSVAVLADVAASRSLLASRVYAVRSWAGLVVVGGYFAGAPLAVITGVWIYGGAVTSAMYGTHMAPGLVVIAMALTVLAVTGSFFLVLLLSHEDGCNEPGASPCAPLLAPGDDGRYGTSGAATRSACAAAGGLDMPAAEVAEGSVRITRLHTRVMDLLCEPESAFVRAVVDGIPRDARDEAIDTLIGLVDEMDSPGRPRTLRLVEGLTADEAVHVDVYSPWTLFRSNHNRVRVISVLAKRHAGDYVSAVLREPLSRVWGAAGVSFVLDPLKVPDEDQRAQNMAAIQVAVLEVLDSVFATPPPPFVVTLLRAVVRILRSKFPDAADEVALNAATSNCVILGSTLQTLVNRQMFAQKSAHMQVLNPFLAEQIPRLTAWFDSLLRDGSPPSTPRSAELGPMTLADTAVSFSSLERLVSIIHNHAGHILDHIPRPDACTIPPAALEATRALVASLATPPSPSSSSLDSSDGDAVISSSQGGRGSLQAGGSRE
ncbi:uncharacterized protein AMSG_05270 [Thecamonas trahens ATCC 50062]|uniref:Ras-GAP domain-containing protein n=1 Tax=Thecamonas trahens ATCC 50062 TaxID=461836 RepID=A0A0L0DAL1_THETB|nr:hypothetical protein AMSG_05270 [Thecamonas trahens ATCC 50062]KNC49275.1 hypothetical protein AMSG_05270 [Thecamonas trahens ATCC 50062]|eukprot:XP_013757989.1 hypothetical protein AMSG_05270 [Thecamonas trahens ATCC 50062]